MYFLTHLVSSQVDIRVIVSAGVAVSISIPRIVGRRVNFASQTYGCVNDSSKRVTNSSAS